MSSPRTTISGAVRLADSGELSPSDERALPADKLPPVDDILKSEMSSVEKASALSNKWWFESPGQLDDLKGLFTAVILYYDMKALHEGLSRLRVQRDRP